MLLKMALVDLLYPRLKPKIKTVLVWNSNSTLASFATFAYRDLLVWYAYLFRIRLRSEEVILKPLATFSSGTIGSLTDTKTATSG
jgi:hypothetical protein